MKSTGKEEMSVCGKRRITPRNMAVLIFSEYLMCTGQCLQVEDSGKCLFRVGRQQQYTERKWGARCMWGASYHCVCVCVCVCVCETESKFVCEHASERDRVNRVRKQEREGGRENLKYHG